VGVVDINCWVHSVIVLGDAMAGHRLV